jgi:DNA-binding response OmpR family regulator
VYALLAQGDEPQAHALRSHLKDEGFAVAVADGEAAVRAWNAAYDVVLLDLGLPEADGQALLRRWRREGLRAPVLALSRGAGAADRVRWLDAGADDCVSRPFDVRELTARLRALVRRAGQGKAPALLRAHDLEIDPAARTVRRSGRPIALSPREFTLLEFLARRRGRVASGAMIRERLYGNPGEIRSNAVAVYVRYLRAKIDRGFHLPLILTRRGEGYLLRGDG